MTEFCGKKSEIILKKWPLKKKAICVAEVDI